MLHHRHLLDIRPMAFGKWNTGTRLSMDFLTWMQYSRATKVFLEVIPVWQGYYSNISFVDRDMGVMWKLKF